MPYDIHEVASYTRSLIESSLDPLVTIAANGEITDVNLATEEITGLSKDALIGTDFANYFTDPEKATAGYQEAYDKGHVRNYSLELKHVNGRVTPVLYNASVYRDSTNKVVGVFAAARDISEQLAAEKKLQDVASYTRSLIESSLDPLVTIATNGEITDVNLATEEITGLSKDMLVGTDFAHYFTDPEKATAGYQEAYDKGHVRNYFLELKHRDGHVTPVLYNASVYKDSANNVVGVFAAARDISEQIKSARELEEATKAKSEFLANMSHELRTPLHGILSFSSFGISKSATVSREKLIRYFSNIQISGRRLLALLNDLLDLSKFESGKMMLNKKSASLPQLFDNCYLEQEQRLNDLGVRVEINNLTRSEKAVFDDVRIGQVITNILSNAIKYSPKGGTIYVTMEQDTKNLHFTMRDQGVGIPEGELLDVFDAFIQSSKTNSGAGGTGLGLAICKHIIDAHKGKIWADNQPDGGAVFQFLIPLVEIPDGDVSHA